MAKAKEEIRSLARKHTTSAINCLKGVMNETKSPPAARVQAATALLDRGWGKPLQEVNQKTDITQWVVSEKELSPDEWQREYGNAVKGNGADKGNGSA